MISDYQGILIFFGNCMIKQLYEINSALSQFFKSVGRLQELFPRYLNSIKIFWIKIGMHSQ